MRRGPCGRGPPPPRPGPPGPCGRGPPPRRPRFASSSTLDVAPQAPARFGRADVVPGLVRLRGSGTGRGPGGCPDAGPRRAFGAPASRRGRLPTRRHGSRRSDLDELESSNRGSVLDHVEGCQRGPLDTRRGGLDRRAGRLPAGPDLIAPEGPPLTIEPAVTDLSCDRSTEMPTGGAGGAGSTADPAPGRLGLGCPAVRTSPHRHTRMVAARDVAVTRSCAPSRPIRRSR